MNDTISLFDLVELATADVDEVSHHQPALQSVTVSGEASEAITFPVGSKLALPVEIPSGTILEFSLALLTRLERGEDVEFRVYIEAGGKRARAFSEVLTPDAVARWSRRRADLTDWGAASVILILETRWANGVAGAPLAVVAFAAPATAGTYYYGACVDAVAGESDTTNNCSESVRVRVGVEVGPSAPDLVVLGPSVSDSVETGGTFRILVTVQNLGAGQSAATTVRFYRSTDATIHCLGA